MATKGTGDTGYHSDYERPVQSYVYCCYGDCPGLEWIPKGEVGRRWEDLSFPHNPPSKAEKKEMAGQGTPLDPSSSSPPRRKN